MTRRIGVEDSVILIGGVALNEGFVDSLGNFLKTEILVPQEPIYTNALGAALLGQQRS